MLMVDNVMYNQLSVQLNQVYNLFLVYPKKIEEGERGPTNFVFDNLNNGFE